MAALTAFGDFVAMTAPYIWGGPNELVNNLQKRSYILPRFLMGRDASEYVGGGERIRTYLLTDPNGTFQMTGPNVPSTWTNPQMTKKAEIAYRYAQIHWAYTAQEVDLNEGSDKVRWKSVRNAKMAGGWTEYVNGVESRLWAVPDKTKMEDINADQGDFYSIPAFANEQTNGLFGTVTTTSPGGAWTTVEGLDNATVTNWKPAQQGYGSGAGDGFDPAKSDNIAASFDQMFYKVRFESPGMREQYFQNPRLYRQFIACSRDGITKYKHLLRRMQDTLVVNGRQDPAYMHPTYSGIDILYASELDTATLYSKVSDTTNVATEAGADKTGPRYYWLNANYLHMVWHPKWYLKILDEFSPEAQRTTYITPVQSWLNMFCTSLMNQGIVYPLADH